MTTQVAIKMEDKLKKRLMKKAKHQGVTVTFVLNRLARDYVEKDYEVKILHLGEQSTVDNAGDVSFDEVFKSPRIIDAANRLARLVKDKNI